MGDETPDAVCVYADAGGVSHLVDVALPTAGRTTGTDGQSVWSGAMGAAGWMLIRGEAGSAKDWHRASGAALSIVVEGAWEIEAGDGARRTLGLGSMLLMLDATGQGHRSRVPGEGCATLGIGLDAEARRTLGERVVTACAVRELAAPLLED